MNKRTIGLEVTDMKIAEIYVNGVTAVASRVKKIPKGIIGATVKVTFANEWADLAKTAVFQGVVTKDVLVDGNSITIPAECVDKSGYRLRVGFYGVADETLAIPTIWTELGTIRDATDPSGDTSTDPTLPVWAQLQDQVDNITATTDEQIQEAIDKYLEENPVVGTPGKDGQDGSPGKDGTSATHSWNGTTLTVTSASGTSSADLKGAKGDKGDPGEPGQKGEQGIQGIPGEKGDKGDTGAAGKDGSNGQPGADGVSPTITANKSGKVTTITITDKNGTKTATINDGSDGSNGKDGTSVTVKSASESTADGGSNVVTFSDGKTLTIKNGSKGSTGAAGTNGKDGKTPVKGVDYWTAADQESIVQDVIAALGTPVFGRVDADNNIILTGALADGTYTLKYEDADGDTTDIGTIDIGGRLIGVNMVPLSINADGTDYVGTNGEDGYKVGYRVNSSGAEAVRDTLRCTGFMPVETGDTIQFANVTFSANINDNGYERVNFYDSNFSVLSGFTCTEVAAASGKDKKDGVVEAATFSYGTTQISGTQKVNYLTSFRIVQDGAKYMRMCAQDLGGSTIIKVQG